MEQTKVPLREKVAFTITNIGNIPVMTLVSSFLSIFYVTVLGMDEFKVGTMFLVARIFDGVNDPIIGFLMDRQKDSKFGKFRKTLILGAILVSLNYLLLWFGPAYCSESAKLTVAYISYLLLGITFPIMDISLNSSLPLMTTDLHERNVLSSIKMVGYGVGVALCGVAAPIAISAMEATKEAYLIVIGAFIAIILLCSVGGTLGFRQNVRFEEDKRYHLKDVFKIFSVKPVLVTFICALLYYSGYNFQVTANSYYAEFVLGDVGALTLMTIFNAIGMVPLILFAPKLADKYGKTKVYGVGMIVAGLGFVIRAFCVDDSTLGQILAYTASTVSGLGIACSMILNYGIQADNIDYVEYELDKRTEGAVSALSSMITKIGMGIGGAVPMYILGATKTEEGAYSAFGLAMSDCVLPCIVCALAGLFFIWKYPIDQKKLEEVHDELLKRHAGA